MTLLEDLEDLAKLYELAPQIRDRLRAHAARLREEYERTQTADTDMIDYVVRTEVQLIRRINAGPVKS